MYIGIFMIVSAPTEIDRLILSVKTWLFCWNSWKNNDRGANKSLIFDKTSQNNRNYIIWNCIWVNSHADVKSRFCIYSWGGGGGTNHDNICVPVQFMLQFFIELTDHQECFCFMFVCLFLVFLCVCCFFSILAHFLAFGCMFVKARSKTQEKSFNYIYSGIKINILICLVISVFFPFNLFLLADLQ